MDDDETVDEMTAGKLIPVRLGYQSYEIQHIIKSDVHTCAVCEKTVDKETYRRTLLDCGHWFHYNCIKPILNNVSKCPQCKHEIFKIIVKD